MAILDYVTGINSIAVGNSSDKAGATFNEATYAEEALIIGSGDTPVVLTPNGGPVTDIWLSFHNQVTTSIRSSLSEWIAFVDSSDNTVARIRSDSSQTMYLEVFNGSTWDELGSFSDNSTANNKFDIHFKLDNTVGVFDVYRSGAIVATFSGDTDRNGYTEIASVEVKRNYTSNYVSSLFIADEDTTTITMNQHIITGDGTFETDFGGGYAGIDHLGTISDGSPVLMGVVDGLQTYDKDALPTALDTGHEVIAVGVVVRAASITGSAITGVAPIISDGTNVSEGATHTLSTTRDYTRQLFTLAPDGGAWTVAKLDACEVGFKSKG